MRAISAVKAAGITLAALLTLCTPALSETSCTNENFHEFLAAFQNTPSEQKNMSADRLAMTTVVKGGDLALMRDTQMQSKDDLTWPILPILSDLNRQDFRVRLYEATPSKMELSAFTEERPEIFQIWYFEKNPCWTFVGHMDGTLGR